MFDFIRNSQSIGCTYKVQGIFQKGFWCLAMILLGTVGQGQDVSTLNWDLVRQTWERTKERFTGMDPLSYSGSVSFQNRVYFTNGEERQSPFSYGISGDFNATILEQINMPFSLMYFNNNVEGSHPFNKEFWDIKGKLQRWKESKAQEILRFGASPYYKWVRLHLGHRNMHFSPYTLAGVTFFGVGMELTPPEPKIRLSVMNGRITKARPIDLSLRTPNLPAYERKGWGVKVGYGDEENFIDVISFSAKDDFGSLGRFDNDSLKVFPDQNHVISLVGRKALVGNLSFFGEWASSAYTTDSRVEGGEVQKWFHPEFLLPPKKSTGLRNAIKTGLALDLERTSLELMYERVDPGYTTMGAYFFNNDIENYTISSLFALLDSRLTNSVTIGFQRNNLSGGEDTRTTRLISTISSNYSEEKWGVGVNYSNYQSRLTYVLNPTLDSLNAVVINSDLALNGNRVLVSNDQKESSLNASVNLSTVSDDIDDPSRSNNSKMRSAFIAYDVQLLGQGINYSTNVTYNQNSLHNLEIKRIGLGGDIGKTWFDEKLNTGFGVNVFRNKGGGQTGYNLQGSLNASYKLDKHVFSMNWFWLSVFEESNFNEGIINLNYTYSFDGGVIKKTRL